jgi:hypothetical protein
MNNKNESLTINYDTQSDVLTVNDMRYSSDIFRALSRWAEGTWMRIEKRSDGVVTVFSPPPNLVEKFNNMVVECTAGDGVGEAHDRK